MIKEIDELYSILMAIREKECDNRGFKEYLRDKFLEKGLSGSIPNQILGESLPLVECDNISLMCFTEGCKEFLGTVVDDEGEELDLNLTSYFGDVMISSYVNYINVDVEPTAIELDNVIQDPKNPNRFIAGFVPYNKPYEWEKHHLTTYDFGMQRNPVYKKLPNKKIMKLKNINEVAVEEMTALMCHNQFEPNMITYIILMVEGKKPNIYYNKEKMKFRIVPNYSYDDENYTSVNLADGQHRTTAGGRAVIWSEKHKEELTGSFHCVFYLMTKEDAKEYIVTQAKQNAIPKEHMESLSTNDYTLFIDRMNQYKNQKQNIFNKNIASTQEEMQIYNKLIYQHVLIEAIKMTNIDVSDNIEKKFSSEKFSEIITTLINHMTKEFYDGDIEKMKSENIFLTPNIFVGYIALAEQLWKDKDYIDKLIDMSTVLQDEKTKEKLKSFKLTSKNVDSVKKNLFNYFKQLIMDLNKTEQEG
ncbi:hypothetical protein [uncultured Clostridium sp.]|uniref:hypothetical protein n=1 Tax=uncultured Clostridium sp. TaxID=59620 RepID=UPI003216D428